MAKKIVDKKEPETELKKSGKPVIEDKKESKPKTEMVKVMRLNPKTGTRELMEVEEADVLLSQNGDAGMKDLRV